MHTGLSMRGHVHSRWPVEWRGVGAQAREAQALQGGMGRGRALPAEPPMRLGRAFQWASLGALPSHALWLDRLVPGGGSGPQTLPQLLAPGCKPLRGPTIRWLGGVLLPPFGQQRRGRRAGTWRLPEGVRLETPEDILTSLPSFCLPGSDSLLTSPARPRMFPIV